MKKNVIIYIILISMVVFFARCVKKNSIDLDLFSQSMTEFINRQDSTQKIFLEQVYPSGNILPHWYSTPEEFRSRYNVLCSYLTSTLENHGINPALFYVDSIHRLVLDLDSFETDYTKLVKLDVLMSKSYYNYCKAMMFGYFNPRKIYPQEYYIDVRKVDDTFLKAIFEQPTDTITLAHFLDSIQPKGELYKKMQQELRRLSVLRDANSKEKFWILAANMERERWIPEKKTSEKHIWVNVAAAQLWMICGDCIAGTMKVGVGKSDTHETPLLMGDMYEIFLNPTWIVPNSIIVNEISKKGTGAPAYISRNNMKVYKNGVIQAPCSVPWNTLSVKSQPYRIVQDSGKNNSLGKMKFSFDNPLSIYLHDTNARHIFSSHQRDISHGCVRVGEPLKLAFFCLADVDTTDKAAVKKRKFYEDKIRYSIGMKPVSSENAKVISQSGKSKVRYINVNPRITVLIDYRTCYVDTDGKIVFVPDCYKMDEILKKKLNNIPVNKQYAAKKQSDETRQPDEKKLFPANKDGLNTIIESVKKDTTEQN
ncbi:MAG: L,D-transpeptidase family protein [Paludibacteraceae bacterium]